MIFKTPPDHANDADARDILWGARPRACGAVETEMDTTVVNYPALLSAKDAELNAVRQELHSAEARFNMARTERDQLTEQLAAAKAENERLKAAIATPEVYAGLVEKNLEQERDRLVEQLAAANRRIEQLETFCFCQNCGGYVIGHTTCDRCGAEATPSTVEGEIRKLIDALAGHEQLVVNLAAANSRCEKLGAENATLKALLREVYTDCEIVRHYRARSDIFGRIRDVIGLSPQPAPDSRPRWQCSGCRGYFYGPHQETCPRCGRVGYWTGSFVWPSKPAPANSCAGLQQGRDVTA